MRDPGRDEGIFCGDLGGSSSNAHMVTIVTHTVPIHMLSPLAHRHAIACCDHWDVGVYGGMGAHP